METTKIWSQMTLELKTRLSSAALKTWFSEASFGRVWKENGEKKFEIFCKNNFCREQLEKRYGPLITATLEKIIGENIKTVFQVRPDGQTKKWSGPIFDSSFDAGQAVKPSGLNPTQTFVNFVVGSSNKLAFAAAQAVSETPGSSYNPLFLYGGTGVGKTHLLSAIGNKLKEKNSLIITYAACESFTNQFIDSLVKKTTKSFRDKYRKVDVLLIDDVQFLSGREGFQEEFFHTFNELHGAKKQVVLTSDKHPQEIGRLEERLVSRFLGGLTCDIAQPELELKTAILLSKAKKQGLEITEDVAVIIAKGCQNTRELEGALIKIASSAKFLGNGFDLESIHKTLGLQGDKTKKVGPKQIISAVCRYYQLKTSQIFTPDKKRVVSLPRQIIMYLMRKELGLSYVLIGDLLHKKDHTTIIHGVKKIKKQIETSPSFKEDVLHIKDLI
ncbi:chromosomal replication initiator protein DnaA [Candidatus Curtissbacteria bacterium RBG_16_39_7]|uniref:Chromosomal replication initiator protein DnaA n=1 Tax=Candidatus Curtissbacteria bacterium RBG_16_39_7 TaxID=1797707 RepID=A0A1F5G2F1_9BACT|nr:MAG: chromosomal replication initiator protein DnaA [Candidatus Curtissbacteria bacterium RBG_16_39_7]